MLGGEGIVHLRILLYYKQLLLYYKAFYYLVLLARVFHADNVYFYMLAT